MSDKYQTGVSSAVNRVYDGDLTFGCVAAYTYTLFGILSGMENPAAGVGAKRPKCHPALSDGFFL